MPRKQRGPRILPTTLTILAILLVLGILYSLLVRPQQAAITDEVLQLKETEEEKYLDFIAENFITGGPPKDGIPAIDAPIYLTAEEAGLADDEVIFGVEYGDKVLAMSQDILYWHEIVNEKTESGEKFSVTYCPLTGSVIGYKDHNLGVSGALYNSNLVMYDRATDSYYPQILGKAVTDPEKGKQLETFPVSVTTWGQWKELYPETLVLSRETGHDRDYDRNPYPGYDDALRIWFPVAAEDDRFHSKEVVHGIVHNGETFAVAKSALRDDGGRLSHENLTITYNYDLDTVEVTVSDGSEPAHFDVFWFAWYAYHPDTVVLESQEE